MTLTTVRAPGAKAAVFFAFLQVAVVALVMTPTASRASEKNPAAPGITSAECESALAEAFKKARHIEYDEKTDTMIFSQENIAYFRQNRENLREQVRTLNGKFFEMEHAIRGIILSLMTETHAFIAGPPGGGKSAVVRNILEVPVSRADGSPHSLTTFAIQLHQLLSDSFAKGYVEYDKLKNNVLKPGDISNKGTMIQFERAILDEADKGNPVAFAAMLDAMAEGFALYGGLTVKVRTKTIVLTSNSNVSEFLRLFELQDMRKTGEALLDRSIFKIFSPNHVTDEVKYREMHWRGMLKAKRSAADALASPERDYAVSPDDLLEEVQKEASKLPEVDWKFLGRTATLGMQWTRLTNNAAAELERKLRSAYNGLRRESMQKVAEGSNPNAVIYYPPTIFSNRFVVDWPFRVMTSSLMLDLMILPEEKLPTETLIKMLTAPEARNKITLDPISIWRLQDVVTTAAPGVPSLTFVPQQDGSVKLSLLYGPELGRLMKDPLDTFEEQSLRYIDIERRTFDKILSEILADHKQASKDTSEILLSLYPNSAKSYTGGIEELLFHLNPTSLPPGAVGAPKPKP